MPKLQINRAILLLLGVLFSFATLSQSAEAQQKTAMVISHDMGGSIGARQRKVRKLRQKGQRVEIHGRCYSACTMYLGLRNVCVSPEAILGFHGPKGVAGPLQADVFDHWSRVMAHNLPGPLRQWFMQKARHVKSGTLKIDGATLIRMGYARC